MAATVCFSKNVKYLDLLKKITGKQSYFERRKPLCGTQCRYLVVGSSQQHSHTTSWLSGLPLNSSPTLSTNLIASQSLSQNLLILYFSTIAQLDTLAQQSSVNESEPNPTAETVQNSKKTSRASNWTGKNIWKLGLVFMGGWITFSSFGLIYIWGSPQVDSSGNLIEDEYFKDFVFFVYVKRALKEAKFFRQMIQEPSSEKLLPDPLQEPYYQPPYTLVLEMTGVLVHPDWTYGTGWRFKKRPNVDAFLQQIGPPMFEVVIYTSEQAYTAYPLIDNLDPQGYIMYRLFRDATRYIKGNHIKDLGCLNRDLSKVIIVDWNPKSYSLHPRNAINVKKWTGNDDDKTLPDLANFLRTIAVNGVKDVREVLDHYNQFDDPVTAFRENKRRLEEEQHKKLLEDEQKKPTSLFSVPWNKRKL